MENKGTVRLSESACTVTSGDIIKNKLRKPPANNQSRCELTTLSCSLVSPLVHRLFSSPEIHSRLSAMSEGGPHVDNPAQPEQSAQLPQQLAPQFATQEGETLPPTAPQTDITQAVPLPDDIRQQIEQEQALADAQKRVRELEEQVGKLSTEKEGVVGERDGAGRFLFIIYSCAGQVKNSADNDFY